MPLAPHPQEQGRRDHDHQQQGDQRAVPQYTHATQVLHGIDLGWIDAAFGGRLQLGQLVENVAFAARAVDLPPLPRIGQGLLAVAQQGVDIGEQVQAFADLIAELPAFGLHLGQLGHGTGRFGAVLFDGHPGKPLQGHDMALRIVLRLPAEHVAEPGLRVSQLAAQAQDFSPMAGDAIQEQLLPAQPRADRLGPAEGCIGLLMPLHPQQREAIVVIQDEIARVGRPAHVLTEQRGFLQIRQCALRVAQRIAADHGDLHQCGDLSLHVALAHRLFKEGIGQRQGLAVFAPPEQQVCGQGVSTQSVLLARVGTRGGGLQPVRQLDGLVELALRAQRDAQAAQRADLDRGGQ